MGCGGDREKGPASEQQKWDYITLSDFRSKSCWEGTSYGWLWVLALIGVAAYVADTFTAVNLLAFSKWGSSIEPAIPLDVAKWIFVVCILLSWALAIFEFIRAIRVIRRGGVAESYMDPMAVILQSMRMGSQGRGWRRFLVFAELTKSKKGVDYIALFVYFQFKGALRIILAEGPRQVVNAVTLWEVMRADLNPTGDHAAKDGHSNIQQFWINVGIMAQTNREQTVILFTMLFTLVIWVISALSLIIAIILYLIFLWHYIPSSDGRLSHYCRRKIDTRLERIVSAKVKKAIEKEEKKFREEERKAAKSGRPLGPGRKPTLPVFADTDSKSEFGLSRKDSMDTIATFKTGTTQSTMRPNDIARQPTLPSIGEGRISPPAMLRTDTQTSGYSSDGRPPLMSRTATDASGVSNSSFESDAPLMSQAAGMGYSNPGRPPMHMQTSYSDSDFRAPPLGRTMTDGSQSSFGPMSRPPTAQGRGTPGPGGFRPPPRTGSAMSNGRGTPGQFDLPVRTNTGFSSQGRGTPGPYGPPSRSDSNFSTPSGRGTPGPSPYGPPQRQNTFDSYNAPANMPLPPSRTNTGFSTASSRAPGNYFDPRVPSPAPGPSYEMSPVDTSPRSHIPPPSTAPLPFPPQRAQTPSGPATAPLQPAMRSITEPIARPGTVAPPAGGYVAFNPNMGAASEARDRTSPPPRVGTVPPQQTQRSVTDPVHAPWTGQGGPAGRSFTPGPGNPF